MGKNTNSLLVIDSADRFLPTPDLTNVLGQPYSSFLLDVPGANLIQGQIDKIMISEFYFPYDIPNVLLGQTDRFILTDISGGVPVSTTRIIINQGFFTGVELATAISGAFNSVLGAGILLLVYNVSSNTFTLSTTTAGHIYRMDVDPAQPRISNSLMRLLGYTASYMNIGQVAVTSTTPYTGTSAPLSYTSFIDICSKTLTKNNYVRDGSSSKRVIRKDLLCRLYIADEISINSGGTTGAVPGTRPFIIHRQIKNPKILPFTVDSAIPNVDIQLYDEYGNFLLGSSVNNTGGVFPRDFAITFNVFE